MYKKINGLRPKLFLISFIFFSVSCEKREGIGGTSSVRGKVYAKYYDKNFYALTDSAYAPDVDVYIIYGDDATFGERQRTNYDGVYEFRYLQTGNYKVYAYSRDSTGLYKNQVNRFAPPVAIIKDVEITGKKQAVEVADINIFQ